MGCMWYEGIGRSVGICSYDTPSVPLLAWRALELRMGYLISNIIDSFPDSVSAPLCHENPTSILSEAACFFSSPCRQLPVLRHKLALSCTRSDVVPFKYACIVYSYRALNASLTIYFSYILSSRQSGLSNIHYPTSTSTSQTSDFSIV